jgi:uncharacterized protein
MTAGAPPNFWVLGRRECLGLLATGEVGRVGVSIGALPAILPVNYTLLGENVLFRTVPGTKLSAATQQQVVAFEVDGFDESGSTGWSVLVQGRASEVTDADMLARARSMSLEAWALDGVADRYVLIPTEKISGRRFDNPTSSLTVVNGPPRDG